MSDALFYTIFAICFAAALYVTLFIITTILVTWEFNPWLWDEAVRQRRVLLRGLDAAVDNEVPQW